MLILTEFDSQFRNAERLIDSLCRSRIPIHKDRGRFAKLRGAFLSTHYSQSSSRHSDERAQEIVNLATCRKRSKNVAEAGITSSV